MWSPPCLMCHSFVTISRATELVDAYPYKEIAEYCHVHRDKVETVFNTLSYFDGSQFLGQSKSKNFILYGSYGSSLPTLNRLCRVQSLGWRKGYKGLSLQRSRRRTKLSDAGKGEVFEEYLEIKNIIPSLRAAIAAKQSPTL